MFHRTGSWGTGRQDERTFGAKELFGINRHAAINTPIGEVDITWLEGAAAEYKISPNPYDYVFSINRIVVADLPNRNMDAFPKAELHRFNLTVGKPTWQTFMGKPLYFEHNQVPTDARGVIFKSYVQPEGPYHMIVNLVGADKKKDPDLANAIATNQRPFFSMGCTADYVRCSICNKTASETREFCYHLANQLGQLLNGRLVYENLLAITFIEQSSVAAPAYLGAGKGNLNLVNNMAQ
jgi:hypothetical protein